MPLIFSCSFLFHIQTSPNSKAVYPQTQNFTPKSWKGMKMDTNHCGAFTRQSTTYWIWDWLLAWHNLLFFLLVPGGIIKDDKWYYWVLRCKLAYIFANFVWKRRHLWPPRLQYLPDVSVAHALSSSKVTAFAGLWKLLNLSDGIERFLLYILW